jgi:hypothetical protein
MKRAMASIIMLDYWGVLEVVTVQALYEHRVPQKLIIVLPKNCYFGVRVSPISGQSHLLPQKLDKGPNPTLYDGNKEGPASLNTPPFFGVSLSAAWWGDRGNQ